MSSPKRRGWEICISSCIWAVSWVNMTLLSNQEHEPQWRLGVLKLLSSAAPGHCSFYAQECLLLSRPTVCGPAPHLWLIQNIWSKKRNAFLSSYEKNKNLNWKKIKKNLQKCCLFWEITIKMCYKVQTELLKLKQENRS